MRPSPLALVLVSALTVGACASAERPVTFDVAAPPGVLVARIQQEMVAEGFEIGESDPNVGYIRTQWTNIPMGNLSQATHRRYTVLLQRAPQGTHVLVRGEFQRCELTQPAGTTTTTTTCARVDWHTKTCISEESHPEVICTAQDSITGDDQQDLDAFGVHMRDALGGIPTSTTVAPAPGTAAR